MPFSLTRSADGRVRAIWRLLAFVLLFVVIAVALLAVLDIIQRQVALPRVLQPALAQVAIVIGALGATAIMLKYAERRTWAMVMLDRSALDGRQLLRGTALGILPIAVPSVALYATGWLAAVPSPRGNWLAAALGVGAFLIVAAFGEELLARGYPFAVLREAVGPMIAVALTGMVFGVLHGRNPGANAQSIAVVTIAGVFLAAVLLATGSLYAATLAHAAWNAVMAIGLHTPVSGLSLPAPNYRVIDAGPDWATGGTWGPEAGIPAAIGMLLLIGYLVRARGNRYPLTLAWGTARPTIPAGSEGKPDA